MYLLNHHVHIRMQVTSEIRHWYLESNVITCRYLSKKVISDRSERHLHSNNHRCHLNYVIITIFTFRMSACDHNQCNSFMVTSKSQIKDHFKHELHETGKIQLDNGTKQTIIIVLLSLIGKWSINTYMLIIKVDLSLH